MYSKLQDGSFIVCGRAARDAELKTTQSGKKLCKWSVKVGTKHITEGENEAIWTNCQAWGDTAGTAAGIKKGDYALCIGKIEENEYNGKTYKNLVCEFISIMKNTPSPASNEPYTADLDLSAYEALGDDDAPF
jgi:single-stranded DNA-binding protein